MARGGAEEAERRASSKRFHFGSLYACGTQGRLHAEALRKQRKKTTLSFYFFWVT